MLEAASEIKSEISYVFEGNMESRREHEADEVV